MASRFVHIPEGEEVRREQQKREAVEAHKPQGVEAPVTWFKDLEQREGVALQLGSEQHLIVAAQ